MGEDTRKFLCDEMLKELGKWLRIAGYDVAVLPDGTADRCLVDRAVAENRLLLTRDRKIGDYKKAEGRVVLLECNDLDDCVHALTKTMDIDWLHQPFSRCMSCNTPLLDADPARWGDIPEMARRSASLLRICPSCNQLFWDGSHVARMRQRLLDWANHRRSQPSTKEQAPCPSNSGNPSLAPNTTRKASKPN